MYFQKLISVRSKNRLRLPSGREVVDWIQQERWKAGGGRPFEFTAAAAERVGEHPGILFDFFSLLHAGAFQPGYTKLLLPSGELQVVFFRRESWQEARFMAPEEVTQSMDGAQSFTLRYACPFAKEAVAIMKLLQEYHEIIGFTRTTFELSFAIMSQTRYGVYAPTSLLFLYQLLQEPEFAGKRSFIDPACGPGGVALMAALFFPVVVGSDLNARFIEQAHIFQREMNEVLPSGNRVEFGRRDFMHVDFEPYDVVFLYLDKDHPRLERQLRKQLRGGSLVVCNGIPTLQSIPKVRDCLGFDIYRVA